MGMKANPYILLARRHLFSRLAAKNNCTHSERIKNDKKKTLGKNSPAAFNLPALGFRLDIDTHLIMCVELNFGLTSCHFLSLRQTA